MSGRARRERQIVASLVLLVLCGALWMFAWNSLDFLFAMMSYADVPSRSHYLFKERILRIAAKEDVEGYILTRLNRGKDTHLQNLYIQVSGIIGMRKTLPYLFKTLEKYQDDGPRSSTVSYVIDSIGVIANEEDSFVLDRMLDHYDEYHLAASRYDVARALYMCTGEARSFLDHSGKESRLRITEELEEARDVVGRSRNRRRTYEEMITLDRVYRPPGW